MEQDIYYILDIMWYVAYSLPTAMSRKAKNTKQKKESSSPLQIMNPEMISGVNVLWGRGLKCSFWFQLHVPPASKPTGKAPQARTPAGGPSRGQLVPKYLTVVFGNDKCQQNQHSDALRTLFPWAFEDITRSAKVVVRAGNEKVSQFDIFSV